MKERPRLWELRPSYYCERARWALDFKGVDYRAKRLTPGLHPLSLRLRGRGTTVPVLDFEGTRVLETARIIAVLEEHWPQPALYPAEPREREQALELDRAFDGLGHETRHLTMGVALLARHPFLRTNLRESPRVLRETAALVYPLLRRPLLAYYGVTPERVATAREVVEAAMARIEELTGGDPGRYLIGDRFSVADLTAASMLAPIVLPPEEPYPLFTPDILPPAAAELRAEWSPRPAFAWVREMYERHRLPRVEAP